MRDLFRKRRMWRARPELKSRYDVVIIGGGSHGLATAYYLKEHGITNVAVLDKNYIGSGAAGRNTTILRSNYETPEGADANATARRVQAGISEVLGEVQFGRLEVVGPKVSGELFLLGVAALVAGIGLMLLYIWFRFGFTFGAAAVLALGHDVILTFGLFALTQMEFTLTAVGSILTIIGYSINDKIVVLDRVRENLRKYKKMPMKELIDLSVNETLSRTIITGITGLMALTVMAYFGGEALYAFAVSMIFGIIVGTYSSIYIAAPALIYLGVGRRESFKSAAEKKSSREAATTP